MPRPVGVRSADMRRAEMPPATAAARATNRAPATPRAKAWAKLMARAGEELSSACPGCGGAIRLGEDRRQEPAHLQPEVRGREEGRMASPDELPVIAIHGL